MDQDFRFGVVTRQDLAWPDLVKRWRYIEELGFDMVWLPDHIVSVLDPSQWAIYTSGESLGGARSGAGRIAAMTFAIKHGEIANDIRISYGQCY